MLLMIDNYDSFTYNLVQLFGEIGAEIEVYRNDEITTNEISTKYPTGIVISPGPGRPENAGISTTIIKKFAGKIPIIGVCLGHQGIAAAFGANIIQAPELMHGKVSDIKHDGRTIFQKIDNPFQATRYHSLMIEEKSLPDDFEITARSTNGLIMAIRHKKMILEGVQFHPESIMTPSGKMMMKNFMQLCDTNDYRAANI